MGLSWSPFILPATLIVVGSVYIYIYIKKSRNIAKKLPPGPAGWAVFGNMFELGTMPHQTMYRLRSKYGDVLWLKLGSINTLAIQSAKSATELLKTHDLAFSDRPYPAIFKALNYYKGSLAFGNDAAYRRIMRRICIMELQGSKRDTEKTYLRRKVVDAMIQWIEEDAAAARARGESGEVNLPHFLFCTVFNLIGNLTMSRDLLDSQSKEGPEFFDAMDKIMRWAGTPNVAEFFPFLNWLDPQGLRRNTVWDLERAMKIVSKYVKERVHARQSGQEKDKDKDFLDVLLEYEGDGKEGPAKISGRNMIIIILEMFIAGTYSAARSIEWGMTELLRNPEIMRKVKEELNRVVGSKRKVVLGTVEAK